jgi:predicted nucleic acid-binding protein
VAIVCDTSPLSYLVLIGEVEMLPELYGEVWVPPAVEEELLHPEGPPEVREQVGSGPEWLKVKSLSEKSTSETSPSGDLLSELSGETAELVRDLDQGERAAIQLATGSETSLLVIDERDGRRVAKELSIPITGTIGVLDLAGEEGLVGVRSAVDRLRETSFRASPKLYQWLLERHR